MLNDRVCEAKKCPHNDPICPSYGYICLDCQDDRGWDTSQMRKNIAIKCAAGYVMVWMRRGGQ